MINLPTNRFRIGRIGDAWCIYDIYEDTVLPFRFKKLSEVETRRDVLEELCA